ncbi:MAG: hypothetical protein ACOYXT_18915 [Bacteroidota bacterium]
MLTAEVLGLTYHRIILESATADVTQELKDRYDYSFVVSMGLFSDPDYEVLQKKSCMIDLTQDLDKIIGNFNSTSRNEYRRSERTEGLVFQTSYEDFEKYYTFYAACENDRGWYPVPPDELKNSFVFSASYHQEFISGMSCYAHEKRLRVSRIYSLKRSNQSAALNNTLYGSAAKRIVVEICKFGIERGYHTLDLGGVDLSDQVKSGITQFKLSLGGEVADVKLGRYMKQGFKDALPEIKNKGWDIT